MAGGVGSTPAVGQSSAPNFAFGQSSAAGMLMPCPCDAQSTHSLFISFHLVPYSLGCGASHRKL